MRARQHLADTPASGGPYWIANFDEADFSSVTGGILKELLRQSPKEFAEAAIAELSDAVQSTRVKTSQNFAIDQIALPHCYFLRGDIASVVEETNLALPLASSIRPTREGGNSEQG
jgi:hypothetical protein